MRTLTDAKFRTMGLQGQYYHSLVASPSVAGRQNREFVIGVVDEVPHQAGEILAMLTVADEHKAAFSGRLHGVFSCTRLQAIKYASHSVGYENANATDCPASQYQRFMNGSAVDRRSDPLCPAIDLLSVSGLAAGIISL
ncbi:hypothetical protein [Brevundimonas goettingensis]|uniref:Uncharacterized protein n=1 Tax=Brevundimonas goettingensis TaxID=2774190 RepID=A0A975C757_9CAUL|nr:hypothetical protein [Brevundimonas goettingensis]QTC92812.1 hypothetical protein IFJ75_08190 [Brevundimonas goettingensis]